MNSAFLNQPRKTAEILDEKLVGFAKLISDSVKVVRAFLSKTEEEESEEEEKDEVTEEDTPDPEPGSQSAQQKEFNTPDEVG